MEDFVLNQDIENALSLLDVAPCSNDTEELINQFWDEIGALLGNHFNEVIEPYCDELSKFEKPYTASVELYFYFTCIQDGEDDNGENDNFGKLKLCISIVEQHKKDLISYVSRKREELRRPQEKKRRKGFGI